MRGRTMSRAVAARVVRTFMGARPGQKEPPALARACSLLGLTVEQLRALRQEARIAGRTPRSDVYGDNPI